jgi:hypothetical protein
MAAELRNLGDDLVVGHSADGGIWQWARIDQDRDLARAAHQGKRPESGISAPIAVPSTTTAPAREPTMLTTKRKPATVGEILTEEFMLPMNLT